MATYKNEQSGAKRKTWIASTQKGYKRVAIERVKAKKE